MPFFSIILSSSVEIPIEILSKKMHAQLLKPAQYVIIKGSRELLFSDG